MISSLVRITSMSFQQKEIKITIISSTGRQVKSLGENGTVKETFTVTPLQVGTRLLGQVVREGGT